MYRIWNKIKRLRIERNMTQDELAKILGYSSRSTINKIESDINTLSYDKLLKLVDVFKIDINELINRVDELRIDNNINEGDNMYINELIDFINNNMRKSLLFVMAVLCSITLSARKPAKVVFLMIKLF